MLVVVQYTWQQFGETNPLGHVWYKDKFGAIWEELDWMEPE